MRTLVLNRLESFLEDTLAQGNQGLEIDIHVTDGPIYCGLAATRADLEALSDDILFEALEQQYYINF